MDDEDYKSLLIVNDSSDAILTLYLYARWDLICWISKESKIIYPSQKYLYRSKKGFKFELVARFEDKKDKETKKDSQDKENKENKKDKRPKEKKVLEFQPWKENKLFKITGSIASQSLEDTEGDLANYPIEKRICLRKLQRDKELKSTSGGRNLYEILGLDMAKVREMSKEKQKEAIKRGYHTQIRRWHPDNNGGDEENAKEIICAYEILKDEALCARYNNLADHDEGWLSWRRYKAIFKPERVNEEQKRAYRKRMCLFALSVAMTLGGVCLTTFTAGLAAPGLVAIGAVFGGGFIGGGLQSLQHTLNKRAIVDECLVKEWLMKAGFGFLGGAATGGAAAGFTAAITGLGSAALESAAITAGQYIGVGAATGATGGVASSISSDAGRKFVDGEQITLKQAFGHAACGALIGAAAGVAGGAVTKGIVANQTSAASANLEGEIAEQVAIVTGARRLGNVLVRNVPRMLTENGTEAVMGTVSGFAEERLDDSVENRSPSEHAKVGIQNFAANTTMGAARECTTALTSHGWNERKVHKRVNEKLQNASPEAENITSEIKQELKGKVRLEMDIENNEHRHKLRNGKCSVKYQPLSTQEKIDLREENKEDRDSCCTGKWPPGYQPLNNEETSSQSSLSSSQSYLVEDSASEIIPEEANGKVKYISEGYWLSKMVVSYFLNGKEIVEEARGSGTSVDIPSVARNIKVKFQVQRPFWGHICKYDRFRGCWYKPYEPHVFCYDSPPSRTFTTGGRLWYEKVIRVSDEYHDETKEM